MERYTIFAVGGPDNRSENGAAVAPNHREAIEEATSRFRDYGAIEVWCGTRLIARIDRDHQALLTRTSLLTDRPDA